MAVPYSLFVPLVTSFLWLNASFAGEGVAQNNTADDQLIQGTWAIVDIQQVNHAFGKDEADALKAGALKVTITADTMVFSTDKSEMKYRLDTNRKPRVLETLDHGKVIAKSVYELKGDDLKICMGRKAENGDPAPPISFDINLRKPGTFPTLFVLKRDSGKQQNDSK